MKSLETFGYTPSALESAGAGGNVAWESRANLLHIPAGKVRLSHRGGGSSRRPVPHDDMTPGQTPTGDGAVMGLSPGRRTHRHRRPHHTNNGGGGDIDHNTPVLLGDGDMHTRRTHLHDDDAPLQHHHMRTGHHHLGRREQTFEITPPGFDVRFRDMVEHAGHPVDPDQPPADVTQQAVQKCSEWLNKYST